MSGQDKPSFGPRLMGGGHQFHDALQCAIRAEELGFDSVWLSEHHFMDEPYWPSPHVALAGFSTRTDALTLGTCISILPLNHPIRIAEEFALLSQMNEAPVVLGVGTGWREAEFDAFGIPTKHRGRRVVEYVEAIRTLWYERDASFDGEYVSFSDVTLTPRPDPVPEIWVGGHARGALELAAAHGDAWLPITSKPFDEIAGHQEEVRSSLETRDRTFETWPLGVFLAIDDDPDRAREKADALAREYLGIEEHEENPVKSSNIVYGTPAECIEVFEGLHDDLGATHFQLYMWHPGMDTDAYLADLELFSETVLSRFHSNERGV